ncbi:MAG: hypothetical protein FWG27_00120 [Treponema sp.]|nr:hypothetical protein [Treponema sp.]
MKEIPDNTINVVAAYINEANNRPPRVPVITVDDDVNTPHYFEIIPFDEIDAFERKVFAIDGSYNSQEFYNGVYIGLYTAGYICYYKGKQIKLNNLNDPVIMGKSYFPNNILITNDAHRQAIYDELLFLEPVKKLILFFDEPNIDNIWGFSKEIICSSVSKLLAFCQEILEWALALEILNLPVIQKGDIILRDGVLRSIYIKQKYLIKIGVLAHRLGVVLLAVTKNSPIKLELSSSFKKIDLYLQQDKKPSYPFTIQKQRWQKLCCWFEVNDDVLLSAYPEAEERKANQSSDTPKANKNYSMFATNNLNGGRGFGIFYVARLDYVEKLQNYDWVVLDMNIFDIIPTITKKMNEREVRVAERDIAFLENITKELTRLTQEHYILGYPYPLVEVHNFVTLKNDFNDELINRVKASLYQSQMMDHVDIENLFLDIHERF